MRIHTDLPEQVRAAIYDAARCLPGVYATITEHGSRSHVGALELRLEGNGYARNTGKYGAGGERGATWDEWGVIFAAIFDADDMALAGSKAYPVYDGIGHFDVVTGDRFRPDGLPDDTHKRHVWEWSYGDADCKKCSAVNYASSGRASRDYWAGKR